MSSSPQVETWRGSGLTSAEAAHRLTESGPNEVPERQSPPWRRLASRFWGPLPWMLEGTIVLTFVLGKDLEGGIIALLLVLNAAISVVHQGRADDALALLRSRLAVTARVRRDDAWMAVPAHDLVPGDLVCIRVGDLVPADLVLGSGQVSLDQSSLTGESAPIDGTPGDTAYGATVVTRGEATGSVAATGSSSFFGRTSLLVAESTPATHLEATIFQIVRYLVIIDVTLVAVLFGYATAIGASFTATAPFALIILIASVPVALPTTFTVAQAVGSNELGRGKDGRHPGHAVLVTRLSAVQEAASMDVLCTDKTGTLTLNQLTLDGTVIYPPFGRADLLELAGLASDESGQDPIDLALLRAAGAAGPGGGGSRRLAFTPFDPATKRTEAHVEHNGAALRLVKGAPAIVASLCHPAPASLDEDVRRLAATGARVLAIAAGCGQDLSLVGLVGLSDPLRSDSAQFVDELRQLGVDVKMVTGDTAAAAAWVAAEIGVEPTVRGGEELRRDRAWAERCSVFAGMFPADKHLLVTSLQSAGHVVGMTGDGVNDAPALKQAEVGIALDRAVDVAKAAASMVLTEPGLVGIVAAITVSRRIYQRMMTWTLNKIIKTAQVAVFLTLGFVVTRHFVTTPLLVVVLLLANDFVTMSLALDRARPSPRPERWRIGALVGVSLALAAVVLVESFCVLWLARGVSGLTWPQTQTIVFLMLVFSGQATVYVVRERARFWSSRPVKWLVLASVVDVVAVSALAARGVLMAPVSASDILVVLVVAVAFMFIMDPVKVVALRRSGLAPVAPSHGRRGDRTSGAADISPPGRPAHLRDRSRSLLGVYTTKSDSTVSRPGPVSPAPGVTPPALAGADDPGADDRRADGDGADDGIRTRDPNLGKVVQGRREGQVSGQTFPLTSLSSVTFPHLPRISLVSRTSRGHGVVAPASGAVAG